MATRASEDDVRVALAWSYYIEKMGDKEKAQILKSSDGLQIEKVQKLFKQHVNSPPPTLESFENAKLLADRLKVGVFDEIRHYFHQIFFPLKPEERGQLFSQRIDLFLSTIFSDDESIPKETLVKKANGLLKHPEREIVLNVLNTKGNVSVSKKELLEAVLSRYQRIHPEDMAVVRAFFSNVSSSEALRMGVKDGKQLEKAFSREVEDAKVLGQKGEPELWRLFTEGGRWDAGAVIVDFIKQRAQKEKSNFVLNGEERKYLAVAFNLGIKGSVNLVDKLLKLTNKDQIFFQALKVNEPYFLSLEYSKNDKLPDDFPWKDAPLKLSSEQYQNLLTELEGYQEESRNVIYAIQDSEKVPKEAKAKATERLTEVISKREGLRSALQYLENILHELEKAKATVTLDSLKTDNPGFPTGLQMMTILRVIQAIDKQKEKTVLLTEYTELETTLKSILQGATEEQKKILRRSILLTRFLS